MAQILFLAHRTPWPPDRGDRIRSHHILRELIGFAQVHVACLCDSAEEGTRPDPLLDRLASYRTVVRDKPRGIAGLEAIATGRPVSLTGFDSAALREHVAALLARRSIDCIYVYSGQMAQFVPDGYAGRVVMDFVDVDSAKFARYADDTPPPMRFVHAREARLLGAFEARVSRRADVSLFVSEAEADCFRRLNAGRHGPVRALGNGIDVDFFAARPAPANPGARVLFTGQMDYPPNVDAVVRFARKVMPLILKQRPDARFVIAGRAPTAAVRALEKLPHTDVLGAVDDIREPLRAADVVVAPLLFARGIQNKLLEAMAMGKPVVATPAAAQGIDATDGDHLLIAEGRAQEAAAVVRLLDDPALGVQLGASAAAFVRRDYRWSTQLAPLREICGVAAHKTRRAA